jgi:hypothetical protein
LNVDRLSILQKEYGGKTNNQKEYNYFSYGLEFHRFLSICKNACLKIRAAFSMSENLWAQETKQASKGEGGKSTLCSVGR